MAERRGSMGLWVVLIAMVAVLAVIRLSAGGVAPTPPAFASHTALDEALQRAETLDRPVLALATADWCGPCQSLKRGALADRRVADWIEQNAVAAYIDFTSPDDAEALNAQRLLRVEAYPTLVLIDRGEIVDRLVGVVDADRLLAWLRDSAASARPAG